MSYDVRLTNLVSEQLPSPIPDGAAEVPLNRAGRYRELMVNSPIRKSHLLSVEGSYFVTTNVTPGTAIVYSVIALFGDTSAAFINIFNSQKPGVNAKRIFLDYIKLIVGVVPASATSAQYAGKLDPSGANRYVSGGTASQAPSTPSSDLSEQSSIARMNVGALTLAAASNQAIVVSRGTLKNAVPIAGDEYTVNFGGVESSGSGLSRSAPVIIGPQANFSFYLWFPANATTAGQFEFEMGHWER